MRVVSMVPSWTETLITAGVNVVGRTQFCIHPADRVRSLPVVGGTKNINREKVLALSPDLLLLDREENPKEMSELGLTFHATHISNVGDVAPALNELASLFKNKELEKYAQRWTRVLERARAYPLSLEKLPLTWMQRSTYDFQKVYYVIWREPWMVISRDTFIGSMLSLFVDEKKISHCTNRYPQVSWDELNQPEHLLLFSSEPYPFIRRRESLPEFKCIKGGAAFINGESMSWFGLRSLQFLEASWPQDVD